jgi:hypothetical protein
MHGGRLLPANPPDSLGSLNAWDVVGENYSSLLSVNQDAPLSLLASPPTTLNRSSHDDNLNQKFDVRELPPAITPNIPVLKSSITTLERGEFPDEDSLLLIHFSKRQEQLPSPTSALPSLDQWVQGAIVRKHILETLKEGCKEIFPNQLLNDPSSLADAKDAFGTRIGIDESSPSIPSGKRLISSIPPPLPRTDSHRVSFASQACSDAEPRAASKPLSTQQRLPMRKRKLAPKASASIPEVQTPAGYKTDDAMQSPVAPRKKRSPSACPPGDGERKLAYKKPRTSSSPEAKDNVSTPPKHQRRLKGVPIRLPLSFVPSSYSVLMGREKKYTKAFGNKRCRVLAQYFMEQYATACKMGKNAILCDIVDIVHDACPNGGAFIRKCPSDEAYWEEVDDRTAREKVGTFFRDCLESRYRSSTKSKVKARRERRRLAATTGPMEEEHANGNKKEEQDEPERATALNKSNDQGSSAGSLRWQLFQKMSGLMEGSLKEGAVSEKAVIKGRR